MNHADHDAGWKSRPTILYRFLARLRMLLSRETTYTSPFGERYFINRYSYVERMIQGGDFEKARAAYLRSRIAPNDVFLDIGANIGFFTVLASRCGATVHAFEPDPANYRRLLRNVKLNGFGEGRMKTYPCALGDTSGRAELYRPLTDNYGRSSIVANQSPDAIRVSLRRLDDIPIPFSARCIVKIDVEGAELQVLDGALATLEKLKENSLWLVEVHVGAGVQVEAVAARFRPFGYRISYFDDATGNIVASANPGQDVLLLAKKILSS